MGKYFKDAASLAAFLSFVVAVVVVIAILVGGFAIAVLGLFIVFAPICFVALAPIRRYVERNHDWFESVLSNFEAKEERLRNKMSSKEKHSDISKVHIETLVVETLRECKKRNVKP